MKKNFKLRLLGVFIVLALTFAGCSVGGKNITQKSNASTSGNTSTGKDVKNITDNNLINLANEEPSTQLDSVEDQRKEISTDEIDLLLNDNTNINFKEDK